MVQNDGTLYLALQRARARLEEHRRNALRHSAQHGINESEAPQSILDEENASALPNEAMVDLGTPALLANDSTSADLSRGAEHLSSYAAYSAWCRAALPNIDCAPVDHIEASSTIEAVPMAADSYDAAWLPAENDEQLEDPSELVPDDQPSIEGPLSSYANFIARYNVVGPSPVACAEVDELETSSASPDELGTPAGDPPDTRADIGQREAAAEVSRKEARSRNDAKAGEVSRPERVVPVTVFVSAVDVMRALGCSRSKAYEHLRRAAGRKPGLRSLLRVSVEVWESYVTEEFGCDSTSEGRRGGAGSTIRRETGSGRARTARTRAPQTPSHASSNATPRIRITLPRVKRR
jgi:hypothetical protein